MTDNEKQFRCGLVMPISATDGIPEAHWEEVRLIVKEALSDTPYAVELVSDSNEVGIIQKRIVHNLYENDIIICDVSAKNPNVMFELGMRLAFDKPAIIIKDDQTNYSFDTSPIEHLQYPRDLHYHAIQLFKNKLREKVKATHEASRRADYTTFLKHFGQIVVARIEEKPVGKDEYLLAALNELRQEVNSLSRNVRRQSSSRATPTSLSADYQADSKPFAPAAQIVREMMKSSGDPMAWLSLASDPESDTFEALANQFLARYFSNANLDEKERARIRTMLLQAVLFERSNWF